MTGTVQRYARAILRDKLLYVMLIPGIIFFVLMKYLPMYGIVIAFKDYKLGREIWEAPWAGLKYFRQFFNSPDFGRLMANTFIISFGKLLIGFPVPILFAILLNEVRNQAAKRVIQTVVYLPHFISWVVVGNIVLMLLAPKTGIISSAITLFTGKDVNILLDGNSFRWVLIISDTWKEMGWSAIIYLAALSGVDPNLYEAASIDGASRGRMMWNITLPAIRSTIIIMLILRVGKILDAGFEQVLVMTNALVNDKIEIIDTYVYKVGLQQARYSFSTAVNLFKSAIGLVMVLGVNAIARRWEENML
ncbi:ABC transporter permease subunit [Eubacteriales bacterium OttesenSCG-928-A19]|nr:ABC transporter permease subunit [Eubacteriales bacterium OttesenSCG-928-A19]